jgi:hypothetical protein
MGVFLTLLLVNAFWLVIIQRLGAKTRYYKQLHKGSHWDGDYARALLQEAWFLLPLDQRKEYQHYKKIIARDYGVEAGEGGPL